MWPGFDPDTVRELAVLKTLVNLSRQMPTREWALVFVPEHDALLVVREWEGGEITAYTTSGIVTPSGADEGDG
jgi:hypothetical protein